VINKCVPNVIKLAAGTANCINQGNLNRSPVTAAFAFITCVIAVILSEAMNLDLIAVVVWVQQTDVFESLTSCFAFVAAVRST